MENSNKKLEESLIFMGLLTFIGGFVNAYAFFIRGGAFVSLHTGNMVKFGISVYLKDYSLFMSAIVPIIGCILGAISAQILKYIWKEKQSEDLYKSLIIAELLIFLVIGFIPTTISNNLVNFILAIITTFQLSNFRKYNGNVHNSTIMTGNLRTLGGYIGDILLKRNRESLKVFKNYLFLILTFPFGATFGGVITSFLSIYSIWICCIILMILLFLLKK